MAKSKSTTPHLELNAEFRHAIDLMENGKRSVFITGRAGTGKSTLLEHFRNTTKQQVAVLAPTGVAALNVRGQTIHSFFRFKPDITLEKVHRLRSISQVEIYNKLDIIVIDEVSMVRADLLDCVDRFLRLNGPDSGLPFGGIRMVFIGDLYQLPPVVTGTERTAFVAEFLRAAKTASIFARDSSGIVRIVMTPGSGTTPGKMVVSARSEEIGDDVGEIDATVEGEEAKVAINGKYLIDVLGVLREPRVALETTSPSSPGVLRPVGSDTYVHVIMPMFVQW